MILAQSTHFGRGLFGALFAASVGVAAAGTAIGAEPLLLSQLSPEQVRPNAGAGFRSNEAAMPDPRPINFRVSSKTTASLGFRPNYNALSFDAAHRFSENWGISGQYLGSRGLLSQPGDVSARFAGPRASGVALGLVKTETLLRGDRLSFTVSQPPGFTTGPLGFDTPIDSAGSLSSGLQPRNGAREVRTELRYDAQIFKSSGLGLSLINRVRPNDANLAPDERIMMMRFTTQF
jgi:hypothetical protein